MTTILKDSRQSRWSVFFITAMLVVIAALAAAPTAHASSGYLNTWSGLYPGSASDNNASCQLCHGSSTQNINPYGFALAQCNGATGNITQRIQAVEGQDSDGQGDSNQTEINANAQPGWTTGAMQVWTRNGCAPAGTNTYPGSGNVDPAAANLPPTADANGPYTGTTGQPVTFDGTGSSDSDGTIASYAWTFGDGGNGTGVSPTHTYTSAGTFTVTLTVTDNAGATDSATSTATIAAAPQAPVADANGPYNGTAGQPVTFDGSGSSDADGTIVSFAWTFGDGTTGTGVSPTNTYAAAGTFNVTLTVTDNDGLTDTATSTATIVAAPVDPIADPNGPYNGTEGVALTLNGSASFDPDGGNITAYDWNFGDGNTGTGATPTHTYAAPGLYTVSLVVVDDEGAQSAPATTTADIAQAQVDVCDFSVIPTSLAFGGVNVGSSSTLSTTVTNNGTAACAITASVTSGTGEFTLASGSTVTVAANGGTASVSVDYTPVNTGADSGTLNLSSNDLNNVQAVGVSLSGTGVDNVPPPVDCEGLNITRADYSNRRNRLSVDGNGGERNGGDFVLTNAYDSTQILATGSRDRDRSFRFRVSNPNPVPCIVRVEQPETGLCAIADVANAPEDCAPKAPPPPPGGGDGITARGDTYATPVGNTLTVSASRVSGVLYNDFGGVPPLTAQLVSGPTAGNLDAFGADGSFTYTPGSAMVDNQIDQFTYVAVDANGDESAPATVVLQTLSKQTDFKILMNYELGMHCTGFEFAYCCVLPPYNSIIAQVVKPAQNDPANSGNNFVDGFPRMLEGDPNVGLDGLNRETVVRDWDYTTSSFKKYQLRYYHDAQPRQEGNTGKPNTSTLISAAEGNSLQYFNTVFDSAAPDGGNALVYGEYNGLQNVIQGDGSFGGPTDNYANGWLNHFYIYGNLEGHGNTGLEADKVRLGVAGQVEYPPNSGAALQPLGPTGNGAFENVLTFSADTGTVVFTQAKVLEDLPIMLTSPRIWEALGLPLTPFEDTIGFFADPGAVDEDAVRPYVAMKASLHEYPSGNAVTGSNGQPVIGFGTAPIDIPNCERCHSAPSVDPVTGNPNVNSPNWNRPDAFYPHTNGTVPFGTGLEEITNLEISFWQAYYDIIPGVDSTWYSRLKGAAINMLTLHDLDVGTSFTANYAGVDCVDVNNCSHTNGLADLTNTSDIPQNTRLGGESVICQRCHADNVIANVKSATFDVDGQFPIKPISEAIHNQHRNQSEDGVIVFNDSLGRDGGCQGCHPAHRSDGVMDDYPITLGGNNANASDDNRLNLGGCFVGRDVHSNPMKDIDGVETPSHLNAVGTWLVDNVAFDQGDARGIWCTNCHTQLGQEMWRTEDCNDLIRGDCLVNPRAGATLADVAAAVGLTEQQAIDYLDPKVDGFDRTSDQTHAIWAPASVTSDANVATIEVDGGGNPVVTFDADGDPSVNILSFCTTDDCVARINANPSDQSQWRYPANPFIDPVNNSGFPVPFSAATDGRDHWLAAGEPHCADCHQAPYVEQSGNITAYPPFNYPAKASLMRYTRGHQDISCQGCHESIHGLYPVTPTIDTTSYAQAAALNNDGSHGPLKCASCHTYVDGDGIPNWVDNLRYNDPTTPGNDNLPVAGNFDRAVSWMHTYTDEADPTQDVCRNCHGDESDEMSENDQEYLEHAMVNRVSRVAMDNAERAVNNGQVFGETAGSQRVQLCTTCHESGDRDGDRRRHRGGDRHGGGGNQLPNVSCNTTWRNHLIQGRVSELVWEDISAPLGGCGW
ncbi:MAG: PKD domain-containing protein [Gammaproteobacteria bacterium]